MFAIHPVKSKIKDNTVKGGKCIGTKENPNKKCPSVDQRIQKKNMSNKSRRNICNSYRGCYWSNPVTLGGRKKKKKKAFPSRKKTHRKNSTKKRARK